MGRKASKLIPLTVRPASHFPQHEWLVSEVPHTRLGAHAASRAVSGALAGNMLRQRGMAARSRIFGEGAEDDTRGRVCSPLNQLIGSFEVMQ